MYKFLEKNIGFILRFGFAIADLDRIKDTRTLGNLLHNNWRTHQRIYWKFACANKVYNQNIQVNGATEGCSLVSGVVNAFG